MSETIKVLEAEREKMMDEAKKYPAGDKRNLYYIGCALGIGKALKKIKQEN